MSRPKIKFYNCIDCGKGIKNYRAKRCHPCAIKFRIKNKMYPYRNGNYIDRFCIDCNKKLGSHNKDVKRCIKCWGKSERGKNNPNYGNKNLIHKHHIYLEKNSKQTIEMSVSKHRKLHSRAYDYLVELKLIEYYINWFDKKYGLK